MKSLGRTKPSGAPSKKQYFLVAVFPLVFGLFGGVLAGQVWPDWDFLLYLFAPPTMFGFFAVFLVPSGLWKWQRILLAIAIVASFGLTTQFFSTPRTCADKVEKRFRGIDRDLSRDLEVTERSMKAGLDDPRVVTALLDTIDDILPVYEAGGSYSKALESAAEKNCARQGL